MNLRRISALLALVATTALLALAPSASATVLTSPAGTTYTGTISMQSFGHTVLHDSSGAGIKIECGTSISSSISSHGAGVTAAGNVSSLSFSSCTNGWSVTTLKSGSLEFHATSGGNGTVTSSGAEFTAKNAFTGLHCIYSTTGIATSSTDIGTLTGGTFAKLDIGPITRIDRIAGNSGVLCGGYGYWTGSFTVSTPSSLFVS